MFAATPVAAPLPGLNTIHAIALTADETSDSDLLTPWIDQYNTVSESATKLMNTFFDAPDVGWQQFIANTATAATAALATGSAAPVGPALPGPTASPAERIK